jgi:hypothetical protein
MKRILGPILLVILVFGVGAAIYFSASDALTNRRLVTVHGLIGSEKYDYFHSLEVIEALRRNGLVVEVEKAGSRQIATSYDLNAYDFAFPAGVPAAEKMRREYSDSRAYGVFFTPMAIGSWRPIANLLVANGIAEEKAGYYTVDMAAYLELVEEGTRWSDLAHNDAYDVNKSVLITSTDVRKSNSAAMYLALASYVANDNNIVQSLAKARPLMPLLESLFLKQGYVEYSSAVPFNDYLIMGMGKAPLVMMYEAQFVYEAAVSEGAIRPEMVLMYPQPTIFSKHILVTFSEAGQKLGEALQTDPDLQRLAIEHGFRNDDVAYFREFTNKNEVAVPDVLVDVIEPPSYAVLEGMIQQIEKKY